MSNDVKDISKYCYDIAIEAIQYTDDVRKWTPNNIRRLIISPDGLIVQLHTSQKLIQKPFSMDKAYNCFMHPNYKPIIQSITNRVCSSIEEIIFCTGTITGMSLPQKELELRSIIASSKSSWTQEQLISNLSKRFVRLRGIMILNCNVSELMNTVGGKIHDHFYQCCDDSVLSSNASIIDIHKDDWFRGYYFRPSDYGYDKEGGTLYTTLHKVQDTIEKDIKSKALDASKKSHLDGLDKKVEEQVKNVTRVLTAYKDIASLLSANKLVCIYNGIFDNKVLVSKLLGVSSKFVLNDGDNLLSDRFKNFVVKYGIKVTGVKGGDLKESATKLVQTMENLYISLYVSLCDAFLDFIIISGENYPITTKVKLREFDRVVYIPSQLTSKALDASNYLIYGDFNGKSISDSLANICSLISFLVVSDADNSSIKKYYRKNTWLEKFNNIGGTN